MKLRIWSDVHTEFGRLTVTKTDEDKNTVLVIAGDFLVWADPDINELLDVELHGLCDQFKTVIYICGNHEFYGSVYSDVINGLDTFADSHPNFHFLHGNSVAVIDGVRFVGDTLWTDLKGGARGTMELARYSMNDYRRIFMEAQLPMSPKFVVDRNADARAYLKQALETPFDGKTVVVTHHLPDAKRAREYADGGLEYAYGNTNMDDILALPIDLWIHGHVHIRQEYSLGKVPVVANPRGYIGHQAMAYTFADDKIWEI